jgi:chloride channel protein, CIC family
LKAADVQATLRSHPYRYFPVLLEGKTPQVLSRKEVELAMAERRDARVEGAITCLPTQTIRELQVLLVESHQGVVLVFDHAGGSLLGVVTLHDLLRAEMAMGKESEDSGSSVIG